MIKTTITRVLTPLFFLSLLALGACHTPPASYNAYAPVVHGALFEYPLFQDQPTGVSVSANGRIFISFPRWGKDPLYSVAEVLTDGSLRPYPDPEWNNRWPESAKHPEAHFICVQSVFIDSSDNLWILDPASPSFEGVVKGGAKLVKVNLKDDTVQQVIVFDEKTAPLKSYLNDVRLDVDKEIAYITDSGTGAIIVTDLAKRTSRRLLANHSSTKSEQGYVPLVNGKPLRGEDGRPPQINADGIALDSRGEYLYYHALTARSLYRVKTHYLRDSSYNEQQIGLKVEKVMETGAVDGMLMDRYDNLYLTSLEDNAIKRLSPDGRLSVVVQENRIQWPDSMSISPDNFLYFTDSQINRMPRFNMGTDLRITPYQLYKILLPLL